MRYIIVPLFGIFTLLLNIVTPVLMLFVVMFIKWDKEKSMPARNCLELPVLQYQGSLPWFLSWFETPDQRYPGDLTIKEVRDIYNKYGPTFCAWYWTGWRNMLMGMSVYFGKDVSGYIMDGPIGFIEAEGIWRYSKKIGKVVIITGHEIYHVGEKYKSAPYFTLKWAKDMT